MAECESRSCSVIGSLGQLPVFILVFTAGRLLVEYTLGGPLQPVADYWMTGLIAGSLMWFVVLSSSRGWLRGVFIDPQRAEQVKARRRELEQERQEILERHATVIRK